MAKQTWVNVGGQWRKVKSAWVNIGGVWKKDVMPKGVVSGGYKEFMSYYSKFILVAQGTNMNFMGRVNKLSYSGVVDAKYIPHEKANRIIMNISYNPITRTIFIVKGTGGDDGKILEEYDEEFNLIRRTSESRISYSSFGMDKVAYYSFYNTGLFDLRVRNLSDFSIAKTISRIISIPSEYIPRILVDSEHIYEKTASSSSTLRKYSISSGSLVWQVDGSRYDMDMDENYIYIFNSLGGNYIKRVDKNTGSGTIIVSSLPSENPPWSTNTDTTTLFCRIIVRSDHIILAYPTSSLTYAIYKFTKSGSYINHIVLPYVGGLEVDIEGNYYIAGGSANSVYKYDYNGNQIWSRRVNNATAYEMRSLETAPGKYSTFSNIL